MFSISCHVISIISSKKGNKALFSGFLKGYCRASITYARIPC